MTKITVTVEEASPGVFTVFQVGKYDTDSNNYTIERKIDCEWRTDKEAVQADVDRLNAELVERWNEKHRENIAAYEQQLAEWQVLKDAGLRKNNWLRKPPTQTGASRYKPELPWNHYVVMEDEVVIG